MLMKMVCDEHIMNNMGGEDAMKINMLMIVVPVVMVYDVR